MEEWYLLRPPYVQLSGFEEEAIDEFGTEGFEELLCTDIAYDVELYNYDLSVKKDMRVIIEDNLADTQLKTMKRIMLAPIGTCKAGMYVKYKNRYWLIVGLVDNNKVYEKTIIVLCNYNLSWIGSKGQIVQRWVNYQSASQYNNGETGSKYYYLRSDQLMILMPDDDESVLLNSGTRMIIDRRCKIYEKSFDDETYVNTINPVIVYKVTRTDTAIYDYQGEGINEILVTQDEQHENDGYYLIDGQRYWLCMDGSYESKKPENICDIVCDSDEIYVDIDDAVFTALFHDENGNEVSASPEWEIVCDFKDDVITEEVENSILISVSNDKLINKDFILVLKADGYEPVEKKIYIKAFI